MHTHSSKINIRRIENQDLEHVADIYYKYLLGDFVGYCGRTVFISYLKSLSNSSQGSLWCASINDNRIIGFAAALIGQRSFNRRWIIRNFHVIIFMILVQILTSHNFRGFLYKRIKEKRKGVNRIHAVDNPDKRELEAYSKWAVVDVTYRTHGDNVASRLLAAVESDVKEKGALYIYGYTERTNLASIFMHLKNGWHIVDKNEKTFKLLKDLK